MSKTRSVVIVRLTDSGATVESIFREEGVLAAVRPDPWSPDESAIAFFRTGVVGGRSGTHLVQLRLDVPGSPVNVSTHLRGADDMRIEWTAEGPRAYPP